MPTTYGPRVTGPDGMVKTDRPLRVLVVDDLQDAAMVLGVVVKRLGHSVQLAQDGREALEKAHAFQPEVVFLDIGMPDIDGYEVCRTLRLEPWCARTTIVAVTGRNAPKDLQRAEEAGFDRHVVKPMGFGVLRGILDAQVRWDRIVPGPEAG